MFIGLYGIVNAGNIPIKYAFNAYLAFSVLIVFIYVFYLLVQFCKTIFKYSGPLVAILIICGASIIPSIILAAFRMPEEYILYLNPIVYIVEMQNTRHWYSQYFDYSGPPVALTVLLGVMVAVFIMRHYQLKNKVARRMKE